MNTHYRIVTCKDELPKDDKPVSTDCGWLCYRNGKWYRRIDSECPMPAPEWWFQPIPTLSREEIIKVIKNTDFIEGKTCGCGKPGQCIINEDKLADAILSAGLPGKEVEIRKDIHKNMCPYCKSIVDRWDKYCHDCGSKINWIN